MTFFSSCGLLIHLFWLFFAIRSLLLSLALFVDYWSYFPSKNLIRKFLPCAYKVKYTLYRFFNQVFWSTWYIWSWVYAQCEIRIQLHFFCFTVFPMVSSQRTTEYILVGLFLESLFYPVCLSIFPFYSPTVIIGYCCFVVRLKLDWLALSIIFSFLSVIVIVDWHCDYYRLTTRT